MSVFYGAPYIDTSSKIINDIIKFCDLKMKDHFYDLGCGTGWVIREASRQNLRKCVGYEISPIAYLCAKIINAADKNTVIYYKNFFQADLSKATVVYCYLYPKLVAKLQAKFNSEFIPGTRLICQDFHVKDRNPSKIQKVGRHKLYLYIY
jgi:SAM-dependent methyltransferase